MAIVSWRELAAGLSIVLITSLAAVEARSIRRPPPSPAQESPLPPPRPAIDQPPPSAVPQAEPAPPAATSIKPADTQTQPTQAPAESQQTAPAPPADDCLQQLRERGAIAEAIAPADQPDPRCVVDQPVRLIGLAVPDMRVDFPDRPIIACATAQTFSDFLSEFMAPLAKGTYGQQISTIGTGPGLECRPRNNVIGAKLSAHGQGLAIDIAQFRLADGHVYQVGAPADQRDRSFDRAVRAGACGYFHTALGPGADEAHAHHWHMDLEPRGTNGTSRFCQ